jgi:urease accessory protein
MNFMPSALAIRPDAKRAQRALGSLVLGFKQSAGRTRIDTFYQQGCLKSRLTRPADPTVAEAVTVNISGGIAGGDCLSTNISLQAGARAIISSQAAERLYRALDAPSRITTRIALASHARLDYLPQETILFDGFALTRTLDIDLAPTATYLGVESLVFGRQAMGEAVRRGSLRDRISVQRDGALAYQDMTRLDGDMTLLLNRTALAGGAIAVASIIYAAPDAAARLAPMRAALASHNAGASMTDGILRARLLAPTAASLRHCVIAALAVCRDGAPLPRTWQS